jgi:hypothetical protein
MFENAHWEELASQGYTVVSGAIGARLLGPAQAAARHLNDSHPDGDWERTRNETWREVRYCRHADFMAIATAVLDPLALEILESAPPVDYVQLASTMPGFVTKGGIGRNFHIDGGTQQTLGVFNILFGVALTDVSSDTVGGFHVLPGSHAVFAEAFSHQPTDQTVHFGEVKVETQRRLLPGARMVVPRLAAGDIVVTHSFLAHGTSANTSGVRRDMIFQRRAAAPLWDPATQTAARERFMRDPWTLFRRHP